MSHQATTLCRPTERYRVQNQEITQIINNLDGVLEGSHEEGAADVCRRLILALNRKLAVHVRLQGSCMYPRLDKLLTSTEKRKISLCKNELNAFLMEFSEWALIAGQRASITEDREAFVRETRSILARLRAGLNSEMNELFPLVDDLGWTALTGVK